MHVPSRYIGKPTKLLYFLIISVRSKYNNLTKISHTVHCNNKKPFEQTEYYFEFFFRISGA